jgi:hypothetical protein
MWDIWWLTKNGCKLIEPLFRELYAFWCEKHGEPKRADLDMSKDEFFDNALRNQDSHDTLHEMLSSPPTYRKILVGEVQTSEDLFDALSHEDKVNIIVEETMVMAFERLAGRDYRTAYQWQLKQMILHHLPFGQALFAVLNFEAVRKPRADYRTVLGGWNEFQRNRK